jgi:hypothetical protein
MIIVFLFQIGRCMGLVQQCTFIETQVVTSARLAGGFCCGITDQLVKLFGLP